MTFGTRAWHGMTAAEAMAAVVSDPGGLSGAEAERRLLRYGPNRLPTAARRSAWMRLFSQFHNLLIYVLLASAAVTAAIGHWVDTGVIVGVVLVNAIIGFVQEGKAERALDAIRSLLSLEATVLRDGRRRVIAAAALVPGDVVFVQSGDKIPADLRLITTRGLRIEEAILTGESVAVVKDTAPVAAAAALGDRAAMAYFGTLVASGIGSGVVTATGAATEIGRIGAMLAGIEPLTTPLLRQMDGFSRRLTAAILVLAGVTFGIGVLGRGYTADEMFLAAVGLAVAAIPEGLPAIMTIALAIGVRRMANRNAIIRRLPAVETLGSITVICSDKTGTLTRNEMTARVVAVGSRVFSVIGEGYAPHGGFLRDGRNADPANHPGLAEFLRGAALCNEAMLRETDEGWTVDGDPMEGALLAAARKGGVDPEQTRRAYPRVDVIPFESGHRLMATLHHDHRGGAIVFVKGAPERLLRMCAAQREEGGDRPLDAELWRRRMEDMAREGRRVLALAVKPVGAEHRELSLADLDGGLVMIGLCGFSDPPRADAIVAVARCRAAGIRVKMITGDHPETAIAVAREMGLTTTGALTGHDIDALDDAALARRAVVADVFARTSPEHKLRLVRVLQAAGEVVAMTGDGVNDAPALKQADVGVAMGRKGTEAAKEAAEMVLADDNFASIAHAVEEGRAVYDNLRKAIVFILPTNAGEAFTLVAAILFGQVLPITPVQILWVNMITAVTLALALAFEPAEPNVMRRRPRQAGEPLLDRFLIWRIVFVGAILVAGTFGLFLWENAAGRDIATARTIAVNTLVMFEVFYLFNTRHLYSGVLDHDGMAGSRPVLVAVATVVFFQLLFTYAPFMQALFDTRAIGGPDWLRIVAVATGVLLLVELEKIVLRRRSSPDPATEP